MEAISRLFHNKFSLYSGSKNQKKDRKGSNSIGSDDIRLVLFKDHDIKGRSLIIDSKVIHRIGETQGSSRRKSKDGGSNSTGQPPPENAKHTPIRQLSDTNVFAEMMFGSVAMSYKGSTLKIHTVRSPPQVIITLIFVPQKYSRESSTSKEYCESESLDTSSVSSLYTDSSIPNAMHSSAMSHSVPVAVPSVSSVTSLADTPTGDTGDSGIAGSVASSYSSHTTPYASPGSSASTGSHSYYKRRYARSHTTSLEISSMRPRLNDETNDKVEPASKRPPQFGIGLVFSMTEGQDEKNKHFQNFLFAHIMLIEGHVHKLRCAIEKSLGTKSMYNVTMEALDIFRHSIFDLYSAPRLPDPVWLCMMSPGQDKTPLCKDFLKELLTLQKQNSTFLSTLITAVLTHHLAWVPTVAPAGGTPSRTYLDKHSAIWLDALAKSHPYNPLWAQLGDLYGAIGYPLRLSRTVIIGKKAELIKKYLYILSYFIRCSEVYESVECRDKWELDGLYESNHVTSEIEIPRAIVDSKEGSFKSPFSNHLVNSCSQCGSVIEVNKSRIFDLGSPAQGRRSNIGSPAISHRSNLGSPNVTHKSASHITQRIKSPSPVLESSECNSKDCSYKPVSVLNDDVMNHKMLEFVTEGSKGKFEEETNVYNDQELPVCQIADSLPSGGFQLFRRFSDTVLKYTDNLTGQPADENCDEGKPFGDLMSSITKPGHNVPMHDSDCLSSDISDTGLYCHSQPETEDEKKDISDLSHPVEKEYDSRSSQSETKLVKVALIKEDNTLETGLKSNVRKDIESYIRCVPLYPDLKSLKQQEGLTTPEASPKTQCPLISEISKTDTNTIEITETKTAFEENKTMKRDKNQQNNLDSDSGFLPSSQEPLNNQFQSEINLTENESQTNRLCHSPIPLEAKRERVTSLGKEYFRENVIESVIHEDDVSTIYELRDSGIGRDKLENVGIKELKEQTLDSGVFDNFDNSIDLGKQDCISSRKLLRSFSTDSQHSVMDNYSDVPFPDLNELEKINTPCNCGKPVESHHCTVDKNTIKTIKPEFSRLISGSSDFNEYFKGGEMMVYDLVHGSTDNNDDLLNQLPQHVDKSVLLDKIAPQPAKEFDLPDAMTDSYNYTYSEDLDTLKTSRALSRSQSMTEECLRGPRSGFEEQLSVASSDVTELEGSLCSECTLRTERSNSFSVHRHRRPVYKRAPSVTSLGTPGRCRSVTPTELSRRRHPSALSTTTLDTVETMDTVVMPIYSLKHISMPSVEPQTSSETVVPTERNIGHSLLAGYNQYYLSDFALHGTSDPNYHTQLHQDLKSMVQQPVIDEHVSEAVCVVADTDKWSVKALGCHHTPSDRVHTKELSASKLVTEILESVYHLAKLKMSPEFCLMHLEDRLQEIYFKSKMLAEYIKQNGKVDKTQVAAMLGFDPSDLNLLVSVAGTHTNTLMPLYWDLALSREHTLQR